MNSLQHLSLTMEEETLTPISIHSRADLLEECSLSLFGRLLTDRQQNTRALKNTLKAAWKMSSDLRIFEVGNNTFQFKFSSRYQMEWVENGGPWNFENNLLLLCRWKKGLTSENITFIHSSFWVQLWGLPFELMTEVVGRDIGNSMGRFIELDKQANQFDQAKFLRIRVELPVDKPLRRGGNVVGMEGDKYWVHFKYERLPTFCFFCDKMGHDLKHCNACLDRQNVMPQYGEWLRASGSSGGGNNGTKSFSFSNHNSGSVNQGKENSKNPEKESQTTPESRCKESTSLGCVQDSKTSSSSGMSDQVRGCDVLGSLACPRAESGNRADTVRAEKQIHKQDLASRDKEPIPSPMEVSGNQENMGNQLHISQSDKKDESVGPLILGPSEHVYPEAAIPQQTLEPAQEYEDNHLKQPAKEITKAQAGRGRIKKLARELGQTQGKVPETKNSFLGTKRLSSQSFPECEVRAARKKKCVDVNGNSSDNHSSAVAAVQHRREP